MAHEKMDRDEVLVKLVEHESIIWKRNHPQFKNIAMKEQAWSKVAFQLGISTTEAERRFKSIREKYRRRKILLERDVSNNVEHSKLKRWDLYSKLGFLDDYMIPRNGSESLGMLPSKSMSESSENISSTNEVSILPVANNKFLTSTPNSQLYGNVIIQPVIRQNMPTHAISRSSQSTPSPTTTTANISYENHQQKQQSDMENSAHLDPIIKMEVPDDDEHDEVNVNSEPKSCENGNFNYVGDYIAAELNKLPLRDAFVLKNILIREVLAFSEKILIDREKQ